MPGRSNKVANVDNFIFGEEPPKTDFEKKLEINLDKFFQQVRGILNKGIRFSDNFDGYITTITTDPTPGVQTALSHGLKRVPTGCLVLESNKAAHIFLGASGKSADTYNVQSDVASVTATLFIF